MTRSTLPDISTTTVPRRPPPSTPPRLDDPASAERLFSTAVHIARQGQREGAEAAIRNALIARPNDSRLILWHVVEALRQRDLGAFVWHLPGAIRAAMTDPLAAPRLIVLGHQAALLLLALFWTVLVIAGLAVTWRSLAHDMTALLYRDPKHTLRVWIPWLLIGAVILLRPGWLGALALLSVPLLMQVRGKVRGLVLFTWVASLILSFPNWPTLRDSLPVFDPQSETTQLVRAGREDASPMVIQDLRERIARTDDPDRRLRLRLALGLQEARRGRYSASSEHLRTVLEHRPRDVVALVGLANNSYYLSRFDEALRGYRQARELAPEIGEIPYNMAQVYLKKLFLPEAGQALEEARSLGFAPPGLFATPPQDQDFSPTVYLELSRHDLLASARFERKNYPPLASIAAWNSFLGAPPLPLFLMLAGVLTAALLLVYWGKLQDEIRHCSVCNSEICRHCGRVLDGDVICQGCAETAERSRSEMVLATLLKNRSRAVGLSTTARLVFLARLLPGAGHLAVGDVGCALRRFSLLTLGLFMIGFGWAFDMSTTWSSPGLTIPEELVHPLWLPLPSGAWPGLLEWPVSAGLLLLGIAYLLALVDASRLRQRLPERLIQMQVNAVPGPGRA
jgi:tetratricopeptide (TPR) repeat protein